MVCKVSYKSLRLGRLSISAMRLTVSWMGVTSNVLYYSSPKKNVRNPTVLGNEKKSKPLARVQQNALVNHRRT